MPDQSMYLKVRRFLRTSNEVNIEGLPPVKPAKQEIVTFKLGEGESPIGLWVGLWLTEGPKRRTKGGKSKDSDGNEKKNHSEIRR